MWILLDPYGGINDKPSYFQPSVDGRGTAGLSFVENVDVS